MSEHVIELAKPKQIDSTQRNRSYSEIGTVSKAAVNAKCNERISKLAVGRLRKSSELIEFNPDAYKVSENAKKARASNRIVELSQPIHRANLNNV